MSEAQETGVLAAPDKLRQRLDAIDGNLQTLVQQIEKATAEAKGNGMGFVVGAADALGIEFGPKQWDYDRETNTFRKWVELPDGRVIPPDLDPAMEVRPTEQEVTAAPNGHATMDVTVPFTPRRARRAAAKA